MGCCTKSNASTSQQLVLPWPAGPPAAVVWRAAGGSFQQRFAIIAAGFVDAVCRCCNVCHYLPWLQWKVAPALAAGNCCILKPSEMASVTCLELAQLAADAGVPPGVLNVITGHGADAGAPLRWATLASSS